MRKALIEDYRQCSSSFAMLERKLKTLFFGLGMRLSTFCPCPGGDSPSAKRNFDAILAMCIPVVVTDEFVWPFSKEFDPQLELDPSEFSLRFNASRYHTKSLDPATCQPIFNNDTQTNATGMQADLEAISPDTILKLRMGLEKARYLYSWYATKDKLPINLLQQRVLPDGGTAHMLVKLLAERATGEKWAACQQELQQPVKERSQRSGRGFRC